MTDIHNIEQELWQIVQDTCSTYKRDAISMNQIKANTDDTLYSATRETIAIVLPEGLIWKQSGYRNIMVYFMYGDAESYAKANQYLLVKAKQGIERKGT